MTVLAGFAGLTGWCVTMAAVIDNPWVEWAVICCGLVVGGTVLVFLIGDRMHYDHQERVDPRARLSTRRYTDAHSWEN